MASPAHGEIALLESVLRHLRETQHVDFNRSEVKQALARVALAEEIEVPAIAEIARDLPADPAAM